MRFITAPARLALTLFVLGVALGGCGGPKIVPTKQVDVAIPDELAKAFEVKELSQASSPAAAQPAPPPVEAQKGRKKKKERKRRHAKGTSAPDQAAVGVAGPGSVSFEIPNRRPSVDPIWVGEKVWLDVTWLNTKAGEFELEVLPFKTIDGRKVYDLKGSARTSELFSLVYKAEDWVESYVDYFGWFPYKFVLRGNETKHIRNNVELFDHGAKKQYVATYDNRIQKGEIVENKGVKDLTPLSQDSLSAIYYVRTLPFEVGKTLRFPMSTNGSQWDTEVTVLGREEVQTKMGYLRAFKCKIETKFNNSLQQQGDAFMWFSDDERKYLLRFEAKVRIGWVAGIAKKIEPGVPENAVAPATTDRISVPPKPAVQKTGTPTTQHGRHRQWFHQLIESISGVKKPEEKND